MTAPGAVKGRRKPLPHETSDDSLIHLMRVGAVHPRIRNWAKRWPESVREKVAVYAAFRHLYIRGKARFRDIPERPREIEDCLFNGKCPKYGYK